MSGEAAISEFHQQKADDFFAWQQANPRKKKRANPERQAQRAVIEWIRTQFPRAKVAYVENDRKADGLTDVARMRFQQARKASGVVFGWPDLIATLPGGRAVFIEMKAPNGRLSAAQAQVHADLRALGFTVIVATGIDDAREGFQAAGLVRR